MVVSLNPSRLWLNAGCFRTIRQKSKQADALRNEAPVVVECRYMQQHDFGMSRQGHDHVVTGNDSVVTPPMTQSDSATTSRQRYTMTVEGVAALLHTNGLDRDSRTIQRWCKSGKIDAISDHSKGDRWLIDPATLQPVIDDIVADMERRPTAFTPTSRGVSPPAAATTRHTDGQEREKVNCKDEVDSDNGAPSGPEAASSADVAETVATLQQRLSEMQTELAKEKGAVQVRDQMIDYLKNQFEQMTEHSLDRAEQVGRLGTEVAMLRAMLPPGTPTPEFPESTNLASSKPGNAENDVIGGV